MRARGEVGLFVLLAFTLVAGTTLAAAADARAMREGTNEGADYVMSMPPAWNGGLVMFAHGYEGEGPGTGNVRADTRI